MDKPIPFWTNTLARLGLKLRKKPGRMRMLKHRAMRVEQLQDRCMLAVDAFASADCLDEIVYLEDGRPAAAECGAPVLTINGRSAAQEDSGYSLLIGCNEPGSGPLTSWEVDWGDGQTYLVPGSSPNTSHTYARPGNYTVTAKAVQEDVTFEANDLDLIVRSFFLAGAAMASDAPENLTATAVSDTQIELNWDDNDGETGYHVESSSDGSNWTEITSVGADVTSCTHSGLSEGSLRYYRIHATSAEGDSDYSNISAARTLPAAPTGLTLASISGHQAVLTWTDSSNLEARYYVEGLINGTWRQLASVAENVQTAAIDRTFLPGAVYSFRVRAYSNVAGNSNYLVLSNVSTPEWPAAPTGLSAAATSSTTIELNWTPAAGQVDDYTIQWSPNGSNWQTLATGVTATSYNDSGLTEGTVRYYRVFAANNQGDSGYSNVSTSRALPDAPTGLTVQSLLGYEVGLSWQDNSDIETAYALDVLIGSEWTHLGSVGAGSTSATLEHNFEPETVYEFRVRAYSPGAGYSVAGEVTATQTPAWPAAPTGLAAAAESDTEISLAWTPSAVGNPTSYTIQWSADGDNWSNLATGVTGTGYDHIGLTEGTLRYYRVQAVNASGGSGYSNVSSTTSLLTAPASLTVDSLTGHQVTLTWPDSSGIETSYEVEGLFAAEWVPLGTFTAAAATVTANIDHTFEAQTVYSFRVRAHSDAAGDSDYCEVTVPETPAWPAAPISFTATTTSDTQIQLDWDHSDAASVDFKIQWKADGGAWTDLTIISDHATDFVDTVPEGTLRYYRVQATNGFGASGYAAVASARSLLTGPGSLTLTSINGHRVALTWPDDSGMETSYLVEGLIGGKWTQLGSVASDGSNPVTGTIDHDFAPDVAHKFRIRAYSATAGYSDYSPEVESTPSGWPEAPSNLSATSTSTTAIHLKWTAPGGVVTDYTIQSSDNGSDWANLAVNVSNTSYDASGLTEGTLRYYRVLATNASGESGYSNVSSTRTLLAAPTGLQVDAVSGHRVALSWSDNSQIESGYQVEALIDGTWKAIGSVPADSTAATVDRVFEPGTSYSFRVRAYSYPAGYSDYCETAGDTTPLWPAAPTELTATACSSTQIDLTWTATSGDVTGYTIEASPDGANWQGLATGVSAESFNDSALSEGELRYYRVLAANSSGESGYSAVRSARTLLATPTGLEVASITSRQVALTWNDNSQIESTYCIEALIGGVWTQLGSVAANSTTATIDYSFAPGTNYQFCVRAFSATAVYSDYSLTAGDTSGTWTGTPANLTATVASDTEIDLEWTASAGGADTYTVESSPDGSNWSVLAQGVSATAYHDATLTEGSLRHYRVYATSALADSGYSNAISARTQPAAPSDLSLQSIAAQQAVLTWQNQSSIATKCYVEARINGTWTQLASVNSDVATATINHHFEPDTEYGFRIRAYAYQAGYSEYFEITPAPTTPDWPLAPSDLVATVTSETQIDLTWTDHADNETEFRIDASPDGGTWSHLATVAADVTWFRDTISTEGTLRYYRVYAVNAAGNSGLSNVVSAGTPLAAPSGLTVTSIDGHKVELAWQDVSENESSYSVEGLIDGVWTVLGSVSGGSTGTIEGMFERVFEPSTPYSFRVRAYASTAGYSDYSDATQVTTAAWPLAPSNLAAAAASDAQIDLTWTDPADNEDNYKIEWSTNGNEWDVLDTVGSDVTSFSHTGLTEGTVLYYRVYGVNSFGRSGYSGVRSISTRPKRPENPAVTSLTSQQVTLTWQDESAVETKYFVEGLIGDAWTELGSVSANHTTITVEYTFEPNTEYSFRVRAYAASCGYSLYSDSVDQQTGDWLTVPAGLTATATSDTAIHLAWTHPAAGTVQFNVQASLDGTIWTDVAPGETGTSFDHAGLTEGTLYCYRVQATEGSTNSEYSQIVSSRTRPAVPSQPIVAAITSEHVTLTWDDNSAVENRYYIEGRIGGIWVELGSVGAGSTASTIDRTFEPNTNYEFRVRAYSQIAGYSLYSDAALVTTGVWPQTPANFTATTISDTEIELAWDDGDNETGYKIESSSDGSNWTEIGTAGENVENFTDSSLPEGRLRHYRIRATNSFGDSGYSGVRSARTLPATPSDMQVESLTGYQVVLTWQDNSDTESKYDVEGLIDEDWTPLGSFDADSTSATIDHVFEPDTIYSFRVRACVYPASYSDYSEVVADRTPVWARTPSNLVATAISNTEIVLTWDAPAGVVDDYTIESSPDGNNWSVLGTAEEAAEPSYTATGLAEGVLRYFRVQASNSLGASGYSNVSSTRTLPAGPTGLIVQSLLGYEVGLSWQDNSDIETACSLDVLIGTEWIHLGSVAAGSTSATLAHNFEPETVYDFRVRAHSPVAGCSVADEVTALETPAWPSAPSGLASTAESDTEIELTWTPSAAGNPTGYTIQSSPDGINWTDLESGVAGTPYTDSSLSEGTTRFYRIQAANASGASGFSSVSSVTSLLTAPTSLTIDSLTGQQVTLTWPDNSAIETTYEVEGLFGTDWLALGTFASDDTTMTVTIDHTFEPGADYSFRVRACSATAGHSNYVGQSADTTPAWPTAPTNFTATTTSDSQIQLDWDHSDAASVDFKIQWKEYGGTWTDLTTILDHATDFADTVPEGTLRYYRVQATNGFGASGYAAVASARSLLTGPGSLTLTSINGHRVALTWPDDSGMETSYLVEGLIGGEWTQLGSVASDGSNPVTGTIDHDFAPDVAHKFRIRAYSATAGYPDYSPEVESTPSDWPEAPSNLSATSTSTTAIHLEWTAPGGVVTDYTIQSSDNGSDWANLAVNVSNTSYDASGLTEGTLRYYRVLATNASGESAYSNVSSTRALFSAPTDPHVDWISGHQVALSWTDNSAIESAYHVEALIDDIWTPVAAVDAGCTTATVKGSFEPAAIYQFRVRAYCNSSYAYSEYLEITTDPAPLWPHAPSDIVATAVSATEIHLAWTDPADDADEYTIERSPDGVNWTVLAAEVDNQYIDDTSLTEGTLRYYRVLAFNAVGVSAYSQVTSAATMLTAPSQLSRESRSGHQTVLTWRDNSAAESTYEVEGLIDGSWTHLLTLSANTTRATIERTFEPNTNYEFRVRAYSYSAGYSDYALLADLATPDWPESPSDLAATASSATQIDLTWVDETVGNDSYALETSLDGSNWTVLATVGGTQRAYTHDGLTGGTLHYYRVCAVNAFGESGYSNVSVARTLTNVP